MIFQVTIISRQMSFLFRQKTVKEGLDLVQEFNHCLDLRDRYEARMQAEEDRLLKANWDRTVVLLDQQIAYLGKQKAVKEWLHD